MNTEAEDNYDMRCRYLYKIYQLGVSPMYTKAERQEVVCRLIANSSEQNDENNRALDLICAYKIVQYNGFEMDVFHFRVAETLWLKNCFPIKEFPESLKMLMSEERLKKTEELQRHLGPNEEILELYNVAIQRDWFAGFNPMKTDLDDGLYDGMDEIEAFNRKNCNALKMMVILLLYNRKMAEDIEFFREGSETEKYEKRIKDIRDLNFLDDPGDKGIEYYWLTFRCSPELFDKKGDMSIDDVVLKTYKVAMFFKDIDPSSKEIRFLPGAIQVWEKADDWKPLPFYDDNGDEYIYWYSGVDVCSYIRGTIGGIPFSELKVGVKCRADNSDEFYGKGLKGIIGV